MKQGFAPISGRSLFVFTKRGEENEKEQLKDFSVVTFKHKVNGKDLGTIGIIGPKRMDYSKVISVMKYINQKLNGKSN